MNETRSYPRRYRRESPGAKDVPLSFRITEDDVTTLLHVYRNRLISSHDIYRLFPDRSPQTLSRRLNKLFRAQYLGRPPEQLRLIIPGTGSEHIVYGLDKEGARLLRDRLGFNVPLYHWVQKNNEIGRRNIAHSLAVSRFMVDLELSVRKIGDIRIIPFDELLEIYAPARTKSNPTPDRWRAPINWKGHDGEEGTQPDSIFALEYTSRKGEANRAFFFLEIDEGNETIVPGERQQKSGRFFRSSSILRKMIVYAFSHRDKAHERVFGFRSAPRILTVTTSRVRVETMQKAYQEFIQPNPLAIQPGLFLFTSKDDLIKCGGNPISLSWLTGLGKPIHIDGR